MSKGKRASQSGEERLESDDALLISMGRCAERLGVHRSYLYTKFIATGRLRTITLGRRRLVYAPALDTFVRELAHEQGVELPPPPAA